MLSNIWAILLSSDYYQYSHVIKRQIVMGDKVRLMLEFNLETFLKCGPPKTNMVRKYFLLSMSRQVRLVEESLIRLSDVSSYY